MAKIAKLPKPKNFEGAKKFSFVMLGFSTVCSFTVIALSDK